MNRWFSRHGQQVRHGELAQHDDPLYHRKGLDTTGQNYIFHKREAESAAGGWAWIFSSIIDSIWIEERAAQNCQGKPEWRFFLTLGMGAMSAWGYIFQRGFLELLDCWYHRERIHPTGQKLHFVTTHWLKTLQHPLHISVFWLSNVNYLRKQAKFNSLYKLIPTKSKLFDQKKNMYVIDIYIYNHEPCRCTFLLRQKPQKTDEEPRQA